jgi:HrpA-like RNA helicase
MRSKVYAKRLSENECQRIREQRASLPIAAAREAFVSEFRWNSSLILVGETGSGKTTRMHTSIILFYSIDIKAH